MEVFKYLRASKKHGTFVTPGIHDIFRSFCWDKISHHFFQAQNPISHPQRRAQPARRCGLCPMCRQSMRPHLGTRRVGTWTTWLKIGSDEWGMGENPKGFLVVWMVFRHQNQTNPRKKNQKKSQKPSETRTSAIPQFSRPTSKCQCFEQSAVEGALRSRRGVSVCQDFALLSLWSFGMIF